MRLLWSVIGRKRGECSPTNFRESALGAIEKAGECERFGGPAGECVTGIDRVTLTRSFEGDERNHVEHPDAGMSSIVHCDVEHVERASGDGFWCRLADHREHRAVVMHTAVHIEQISPGCGADLVDQVGPAALADVDDRFDHWMILPHRRVRRQWGRIRLWGEIS
ncbi:unannotated protein [freshwater metagenome]|uniref:Unannotated protein n=1 Tax=freshwater metagenome TaxID=449393 RepID=A0A6J7KBJ9_9ZZZZ